MISSLDSLEGVWGGSASVTCVGVRRRARSVAHTTVAGLRSISSSNFTICWMSLAFQEIQKKPDDQSDEKT